MISLVYRFRKVSKFGFCEYCSICVAQSATNGKFGFRILIGININDLTIREESTLQQIKNSKGKHSSIDKAWETAILYTKFFGVDRYINNVVNNGAFFLLKTNYNSLSFWLMRESLFKRNLFSKETHIYFVDINYTSNYTYLNKSVSGNSILECVKKAREILC